ncbi:afadin- and alpha-actinin-binding protein isoform X2 [Denticeps clupeoides]|nr:afadin- and alpha-actinin-binding protein-like isoform X2 [Denticeps clupeoides]
MAHRQGRAPPKSRRAVQECTGGTVSHAHTQPHPLHTEQLAERDQDVARLQESLRREREKCSHLQSRCSQQGAELKRREQQNGRLKDRLFSDRYRERAAAIEVLNGQPKALAKKDLAAKIPRSDGRRDEEALSLMLERREAELREAMKLRHALTTLLHGLRTDMEKVHHYCFIPQFILQITFQTFHIVRRTGQVSKGDCDEQEPDSKWLVESETALGDHVTGGVVQEWIKVRNIGLKRCFMQSITGTGTDQDKLIAQLEAELDQSQNLVRLQQQMLQDSVAPPLPGSLADSYYLEEWERLQVKWAEFERQRRSFERERQAFTDAAIRLGHERCQFEQQRASLVKWQYLGFTPGPKPSTLITVPGHVTPPPPKFPSTPCFPRFDPNPWSPQEDVVTPSTPELYSALRLPYCPNRLVTR